MGFSSCFKLYKVQLNTAIDDTIKNKPNSIIPVGNEETTDKFIYCDNSGKCLNAIKCTEHTFGSSFSALSNHWNLGRNDINNHILTKTEMQQILSAAEYLLYGKYDTEIERIMNNEYIAVLGKQVPDYSWPKNHNIFIDKNGSGYSVSASDACADNERNEENSIAFGQLRILSALMKFALDADSDFSFNDETGRYEVVTELIFEYSISY